MFYVISKIVSDAILKQIIAETSIIEENNVKVDCFFGDILIVFNINCQPDMVKHRAELDLIPGNLAQYMPVPKM